MDERVEWKPVRFRAEMSTADNCVCNACHISNGVTVQEWISVDDRLPGNGKEGVLIVLRWGGVDIGWCEDCRWRSEFVNEYEDGEVTHWMPLPPLPKGE